MTQDVHRLVLSQARDHTIYYAWTHTSALPRADVDALTPDQRAYLEEHLHEIAASCQAQLRGLLHEARREV